MSQKKSVVNAAVAILRRDDGKVLIGQRPAGKPWEGWWEFPGGKIEEGEAAIDALIRESDEELGIQVTEAYPWLHREFQYPERHVKLNFFIVSGWSGEPHGREGQQLVWQYPHDVEVHPMLPANEPILKALCLPSIYAITNLEEAGEAKFLKQLDHALSRGLKLIQLREKYLTSSELQRVGRVVVEKAHAAGAKVMLNGDFDLAQQIGADGVHLSSDKLMRLQQRPEGFSLFAASCHNQQELKHAEALGLDFAVVSPVMSTQSHPDAVPLGWAGFSEIITDNTIPVYALGGMESENLIEAWRNGAHGIAMQRAIWSDA